MKEPIFRPTLSYSEILSLHSFLDSNLVELRSKEPELFQAYLKIHRLVVKIQSGAVAPAYVPSGAPPGPVATTTIDSAIRAQLVPLSIIDLQSTFQTLFSKSITSTLTKEEQRKLEIIGQELKARDPGISS